MIPRFVTAFERIIARRIERAGTDLVMGLVSQTPVGAALEAANMLDDLLSVDRRLVEAGRRVTRRTPVGKAIEATDVAKRAFWRFGWLAQLLAPGDPRSARRRAPGPRQSQRAQWTQQSRQARRPRQDWQRGGWARSRQDWLDNKWRHDWRSQPRRPAGTPAGGEWMEGRLDYPLSMGSVVSRSQRRRRVRAIIAYKQRMVGVPSRPIQTSWATY